MTFRIRVVTQTDEGGLHLRDVHVRDTWRHLPGDALSAFHRYVCDVLVCEGVSMHAVAECTMCNLSYVSSAGHVVCPLFDPHVVPQGSLVFFRNLSARITQQYDKPARIHAYDMCDMCPTKVLFTYSPAQLRVCLDGNLQLTMPFPLQCESGQLLSTVMKWLVDSGVSVEKKGVYITNPAWDQLIDFYGRHQLQDDNCLRIVGAVQLNSRTLSMRG